MEMLTELFHNAMDSTAAGFVGVTGIWVYMGVIVVTAFYRIRKGDHLDHH